MLYPGLIKPFRLGNHIDPVKLIPPDSMHLFDLGIIKLLSGFILQFNDPALNKNLSILRKPISRLSPEHINARITQTKLPVEFPRRTRNVDYAYYKSSEWRSLGQFLFPIVLKMLGEQQRPKQIKLFARMAYIIRAVNLPNDEYAFINTHALRQMVRKFYIFYEELFENRNCRPNVHLVSTYFIQHYNMLLVFTVLNCFSVQPYSGNQGKSGPSAD